jgi:hypothetical protein
MGFEVAGVPYQKGGVLAAMQYLTATAPQGNRADTLAKAA